MEKWVGKIALVVGASYGLGADLCERLCKSGVIVVGAARGVDKIQAMADKLKNEPGKIIPVKCDLFIESDIINMFEFIETNYGGISILVNVASISSESAILDSGTDNLAEVMDLAFLSLAICCKLATKNMIKYGTEGHIVNLGGTSSYWTSVFDGFHWYSVVKFMLRAFGDALRAEFRANNINIRISHIGPGHIRTGAMDRGGINGKELMFMVKLFGELYNMKSKDFPKDMPFPCKGDEMYTSDVLPALEMSDVNDYVIQCISSPKGAECMDIIMKPTDRRHSIFETDHYWSELRGMN